MSQNIQALLKRKRLTGDEVGRVLILTLIEANTGGDTTPIVDNIEMLRLVRCMQTDGDRNVYAAYIDLYNALVYEINTTEAFWQQAENALFRLLSYFGLAQAGEDLERALDTAPLVLTRAQAQRLCEQAALPSPAAAIAALYRQNPGDPTLFSMAQRVQNAGIAYLDEETAPQGRVQQGAYVESETLHAPPSGSLRLLASDQAIQQDIHALPGQMFLPALRYMIAYNEMLEIIAARYQIPELEALMKDDMTLRAQAIALNDFIARRLRKSVYGTQDLQRQKLALIDRAMPPIDLSQLEPEEDCLELIREKFATDTHPLRTSSMTPMIQALIASMQGVWEGSL